MEFLNLMTLQVFHDLYEGAVAPKRTLAWDGEPSFLINRQSLTKISVQGLFQWNDLNHDVDLFLHCRHVDFVTSSCRFQAPKILCRGTGSPSSRLLLFLAFFFFSDRPTQNQKTYSTRNETKGGWP